MGHLRFHQEKNDLFRLRAEAGDSRWLVFVFVSGTVVAPIEARELERFEIHACSRSNLNVHLTSVRRAGGTRAATGVADPAGTGEVDIKLAPSALRDLEALEFSRLIWSNCSSIHDDEH